MAKKRTGKRSTATRRRRSAMPREVRGAYGEVRQGVAHLERSIAQLRVGLRRAEREIEADARKRVRTLRKEAQVQLRGLQSKQREAARTLKKLAVAAGESWRDVKRSADSILGDARTAAAAIGQRFRSALRS